MSVVTLDALHDAITQALRDHFGPLVSQVGAYEPQEAFTAEGISTLQTPALLLECEGIEQDGYQDPQGRLRFASTWVIHCILSMQTTRLQQTLPQFAAAVMALVLTGCPGSGGLGTEVRGNLWGLGEAVEPPMGVQSQAGEFVPGLNGRDSWIVRWEQVIYLDTEYV